MRRPTDSAIDGDQTRALEIVCDAAQRRKHGTAVRPRELAAPVKILGNG